MSSELNMESYEVKQEVLKGFLQMHFGEKTMSKRIIFSKHFSLKLPVSDMKKMKYTRIYG